MTLLNEWFERACGELGVRVEFGFKPSVPDAPDLRPVLRIPDFGAANGMLIFREYDDVRKWTQQLDRAGYGFSVLDEPLSREEFDLQSFKEMLIHWGWSGDAESRPMWMPL